MPRQLNSNPNRTRRHLLLWIGVGIGLAIAGVAAFRGAQGRHERRNTSSAASGRPPDEIIFAAYGKSQSCKSCHTEVFEQWANSHHALAERPVSVALDSSAFASHFKISHGTQNSEALLHDQEFSLLIQGHAQKPEHFIPERVVGVNPLRQYLIPWIGGRYQATELAFAPESSEWFDVFGTENRVAGEWGHWTGRGMTWNSMCAACHNTRLRKNYQPDTDSYKTTMAEMSVGCEACGLYL